MSDFIQQQRNHINQIDQKLLDLLSERAKCALAIGAFKQEQGLPIYVAGREQEILSQLASQNPGPLSDSAIQQIFKCIIEQMRALQQERFE